MIHSRGIHLWKNKRRKKVRSIRRKMRQIGTNMIPSIQNNLPRKWARRFPLIGRKTTPRLDRLSVRQLAQMSNCKVLNCMVIQSTSRIIMQLRKAHHHMTKMIINPRRWTIVIHTNMRMMPWSKRWPIRPRMLKSSLRSSIRSRARVRLRLDKIAMRMEAVFSIKLEEVSSIELAWTWPKTVSIRRTVFQNQILNLQRNSLQRRPRSRFSNQSQLFNYLRRTSTQSCSKAASTVSPAADTTCI